MPQKLCLSLKVFRLKQNDFFSFVQIKRFVIHPRSEEEAMMTPIN